MPWAYSPITMLWMRSKRGRPCTQYAVAGYRRSRGDLKIDAGSVGHQPFRLHPLRLPIHARAESPMS